MRACCQAICLTEKYLDVREGVEPNVPALWWLPIDKKVPEMNILTDHLRAVHSDDTHVIHVTYCVRDMTRMFNCMSECKSPECKELNR